MSEIPNALTPDEWTHRVLKELMPGEQWNPYVANMRIEAGKIAVDNSSLEYRDALLDPFKVMALANAALPDDDPRKITREDVRMLRQVAARTARVDVEITAPDGSVQRYEGLTHLAAKLAALLPPE